MKKTKNLKGFTLVEEVVSLFILSILILVASGMMIAAMRVYSVNVKTQSAQNKGQYVYDLLDDKLTYASGIQYQKIGETETLNPQNETYFKGGEMKKIFEDNEVCQNITVDKNGITNSFNNKKIEFGQYNVDVSLELETQVTTAASASADNSMNDEALFNLVSNSEVIDSAGYLTPQGEVSFLGGLEIMNQSAEVRTVSNIGDNLNYTIKEENGSRYYFIDNIPYDVSCVEITVENKNPNPYEYIYLSYQTDSGGHKEAFNKPFTEETFSINLDFDSWIKLFNPDKYNIKSVKVKSLSSALPLKVNVNGKEYTNGQTTEIKIKMGESFQFSANQNAIIDSPIKDEWNRDFDILGNDYIDVKGNNGQFTFTAKKYYQYGSNKYKVIVKSGNRKQSVTISVEVLPFPLSVTIDNITYTYNDIPNNTIDVNMYTNETKNIKFNTENVQVQDNSGGNITPNSTSITSHGNTGGYNFYCSYGGAGFTIRVNVNKPEDPFRISNNENVNILINNGFQIQTNKTENGNLTENAKKTYEKIEYYFVDDSGNRIETDIAEISETGYVTAKKAGTVKICATAKRKDGKADEVSTNKVTISVSEPISVSPNEITVFAGDEFNSLPFEVKNSTNYETSVAPWGITFNSNGMQVNKDCNGKSTVTVTFRDRSNNSTATLTVNIVKFKILNPTDTNINLQKGKSLKFESNYGQDGISRGTKKFSIEIADQTLISIDENGTNNDITKTIKATSDKIGGSNVVVKFGDDWVQTYYINVVEKERTLKIDNSSEDKDITLWAGETSQTFTLSSTLENFNSIDFKNSDPSVLSYNYTKNVDGTYSFNVTALKPDRDTDVVLTVTDRYYSTSTSDNSVIADEKGIPIKINVQIKVPQINTNSLTMYLNEPTEFNIGDIPFDYMSCSSERATVVDAKKDNGKIIFTPYSKTTEPIKITLTYNCGDVSYSFEVLVTVTDKPVTSTTTTTKVTTVTTTTTTTVAVSKSDKPMSSYRMKLTVTVMDKKGKEMYKRSGSISVMNYENSNMKDKRFPKGMILNNTTDSGFVLKIYYID
ncbi:MAG: prepilin-type N-terminal cleavage/methylation domain-containing protein [Oscillospiraceae bacterium]|nr:prepilin-type N-terminal cleavage/methylation domain-containing protein [Oscillospiraceae bacterium]